MLILVEATALCGYLPASCYDFFVKEKKGFISYI